MSKSKQSNLHEISGKILYVGQPESFVTKAGNTKSFRILVMEVYYGNYANPVSFEFGIMNMGQLNGINEGDWVTVSFALSGQKIVKDGKARFYDKNIGLAVVKED